MDEKIYIMNNKFVYELNFHRI